MVTPKPAARYRIRQTASPDQVNVNGANTTPTFRTLHQMMCGQLSRGRPTLAARGREVLRREMGEQNE